MTEQKRARGSLRVYACGGCGINIGQLLEDYRGEVDLSVAQIEIAYIDTASSNLSNDTKDEHVYIIEGLDGSGKLRKENHVAIGKNVRQILERFDPLDQSVVICSAAGGSGSVLAPTLVGALLEQGKPPIVMVVGDASTRIDADNTLKTLKSFEAVSKLRKAPIVISYVQNSKDRKRDEVDDIVKDRILSVAILFSRNNRELDSADLRNWLRFDRVTQYTEPRIAALTVLPAAEQLQDEGDIITVATLANKGDDTTVDAHIEYQAVGFLPALTAEEVRSSAPVHFYVTDGLFDAVSKELNQTLAEIEKSLAARVKREGLLADDDQATDLGIVL
jgi:hypothetical protein